MLYHMLLLVVVPVVSAGTVYSRYLTLYSVSLNSNTFIMTFLISFLSFFFFFSFLFFSLLFSFSFPLPFLFGFFYFCLYTMVAWRTPAMFRDKRPSNGDAWSCVMIKFENKILIP